MKKMVGNRSGGLMGDGYKLEMPCLTQAQARVATLVAARYSNQQIADTMGIARKTVKNHLNNIYRQEKVVNRDELIAVIHRTQPSS